MPADRTFRPLLRGLAMLALVAASAAPAAAGGLFQQPSIGLDPPKIIRTVPPLTVPSLDANQCQLAAGTCPLGRLQRSGGRCYCVGGNGAARQGGTRTKPQDARPPMTPPKMPPLPQPAP